MMAWEFLGAEVSGGGVDDGGVDRRAAKADDDKPGEGGEVGGKGEEDQQHPQKADRRPQEDHLPVPEPVAEEAREEPAGGYPDVEEGGEGGGKGLGDLAGFHQKGAGPEHGGGLGGAVGEEARQQEGDAPDPEGLFQAEDRGAVRAAPRLFVDLP